MAERFNAPAWKAGIEEDNLDLGFESQWLRRNFFCSTCYDLAKLDIYTKANGEHNICVRCKNCVSIIFNTTITHQQLDIFIEHIKETAYRNNSSLHKVKISLSHGKHVYFITGIRYLEI